VVYEPRYAAVPDVIAGLAHSGDLVITMGIGNVYLLCDDMREACERRASAVATS
jgi:UDP-N-acetylmuramate--alanine ligase